MLVGNVSLSHHNETLVRMKSVLKGISGHSRNFSPTLWYVIIYCLERGCSKDKPCKQS